MQLFNRVFGALNFACVDYVVVGGIATNLHGYTRLTTDIDLVIRLTVSNVDSAISALEAIGYAPMVPVDARGLGDPETRRIWKEEKNLVVMAFFDKKLPLVRLDVFT